MHGQQNVKICHELVYKDYLLLFDVFIIILPSVYI